MNVAAIILAAGGSRRMGSPKQLLRYQGRTLLSRAVDAAAGAGCSPVVVVLGSGVDRIADELHGYDVVTVVNKEWEKGMGTSIRRGIEAVFSKSDGVEGAIVMLCDQPLVRGEMLRRLINGATSTGMPICAAGYEGTAGTPCYFAREVFSELLALADDAGGKQLIRQDLSRVHVVPMNEAAADVDTPENWERLGGGAAPAS